MSTPAQQTDLKPTTAVVDSNPDKWGKIVFRFLLALIPSGTAVSLVIIILTFNNGNTVALPNDPNATQVPLGIFDPRLGDARRFLLGLLVFLAAGVVETALFLVYAAFYINDERNKNQNLGLPQGTVRVFILIIIVEALLIFAMLPGSLGDNKAVILIFGILSTIVGFYYGSSKEKESQESAAVTQDKSGKSIMATGPAADTLVNSSTPAAKSGITPVAQQPKPIEPVARPLTPVSTVPANPAPVAAVKPTVTNNVTPPAATLPKEIQPLTHDPDTSGHKEIPPLG
jgi:hypothetical protein